VMKGDGIVAEGRKRHRWHCLKFSGSSVPVGRKKT